MNEDESINEYKEQPIATDEFLAEVLRRSKENIATLKKLRAEVEYDIEHGSIDEN